jgi:mannose-6-phosphate isomerase-like protein (cupin superfamily)
MLRAARDGRNEDAGEFDQFEPPADGGRPLSDAAFRGPGEGEPIQIGESRAILKADGPAVGGFFSLTETTLAPGFQGQALNRDRALLDGFYVLEGTLSLQLGDQQLEAGRGAFALAPAEKATFANRSGQEVRVLNLSAPA